MRIVRTSLTVLLLAATGMGGAAAVRRFQPQPEPELPFVATVPGGRQERLTQTIRGMGGFTVKAPKAAYKFAVDGSMSGAVLSVSLRGARDRSAMLAVFREGEAPLDEVEAMEAMRDALPVPASLSPIRRTEVAGKPATVAQHTFRGRVVREFRFVFDHEVFGIAVYTKPGDRVAVDTAFAMIKSWKWTRPETPEDELDL